MGVLFVSDEQPVTLEFFIRGDRTIQAPAGEVRNVDHEDHRANFVRDPERWLVVPHPCDRLHSILRTVVHLDHFQDVGFLICQGSGHPVHLTSPYPAAGERVDEVRAEPDVRRRVESAVGQ